MIDEKVAYKCEVCEYLMFELTLDQLKYSSCPKCDSSLFTSYQRVTATKPLVIGSLIERIKRLIK